MIGYVTIKPESLFPMAPQQCIASGKKRIRTDGKIEAQFIPLHKGYYSDLFWATQDQLVTNT